MERAITEYKVIAVDDIKPDWATIHIVLIGGKIPMLAQWRPPGEWWSVAISEKKFERGVTHVLFPITAASVVQPALLAAVGIDAASERRMSPIICKILDDASQYVRDNFHDWVRDGSSAEAITMRYRAWLYQNASKIERAAQNKQPVVG